MAWNEGYHCLKEPYFADTNKKLAQIEGNISARDAQISFAQFCCANPSFAANLLMGIDLWPFQDIMIRAMMQKDYFLGICGRGLGKSTIAGVFIPLYAIFNPGVTIGVTSASFRQARAVFEKIESVTNAKKGRYLRQCMKGDAKHRSDAWELNIGDSKIVAIPLGCFSEDERIRTDRGLIKVNDLAPDAQDWSNVSFSADTIEGESRCSHVLNAGVKECFEIITSSGYKTTVSGEHEFYVQNENMCEWKKLSDLSAKDKIALNRSQFFCTQPEYNLSFEKGYEYGSKQYYSKIQDERIFSCSREFGRGYLSGLFEVLATKYYKIKENRFKKRVHAAPKSIKIKLNTLAIAENIHNFLLCYGIVSKLNRKRLIIAIGGNFYSKFFEVIGIKETPGKDSANYALSRSNKKELNNFKSKTIVLKNGMFLEGIKSIKSIGPRQTYDIRVPAENNYILNSFCSHNSGEKIRGYRFNLLVIDELLLLSEKVIQEVLLPFMAIQINPRERQKVREAEDELIAAGVMRPEEKTVFPNNKLIGLTSASYQFEHLYAMYEEYKNLIYQEEATNVSHAIMQMSYAMAPPGLYDASVVENAKKSSSVAQFDREYMAKFTGDSSGFYSAKKLFEASLLKGQSPTVRIKGDSNKGYLLAIDPNYDSSETSDDFAMEIFEIDEENERGFMVHAYAVASCSLAERMDYVRYLFDNFNIVYMIVDKAGGAKFVKDINDLGILPFTLDFFESNFEEFSEEELMEARATYDNGTRVKRIVHSQYFSSQWIRVANESLAGAIEGKRMLFAAPVEAEGVNFEGIPIEKLKFTELETYGNSKDDLQTKRIDFVDNQSLVISKTKNQCSLIEATTTANGNMRFDLPSNLQKQTGPNKARKDSYSALVLGNWGLNCFFALLKTPQKKRSSFKPRFLA